MEQSIRRVSWRCRSCGDANEMSSGGCAGCGAARGPSGAARLAALVSSDGCAAVQNNVVQLNVGRLHVPDAGCDEPVVRDVSGSPRPAPFRGFFYLTMGVIGWAGILVFCSFLVFILAVTWKAVHG